MMVVLVLMTSCQVSEKWNSGPVQAQTSTAVRANTNAPPAPVSVETLAANLWKISFIAAFTLQ